MGWTCLLLTGLLADRVFGAPHGLLAMVLLAASPPFFAHAMNNPKDLPFAAVSTAILLIFWAMGSSPPWASPRALVLLALVIGLGLNVRAGALLFIGYLAAVCGYWLMRGPLTFRDVLKAAASIASVLAIAVAIGWVGWPWAYQFPLKAPFVAMRELGHFGWDGTVLFRGISYPGTAVPSDYVPRWLWLTVSPILMAGLALVPLVLRTRNRDSTVALGAAVVFPILYVMGTRATLYDGVRHLLFVFPPLAILAAAGWVAAWQSATRVWRPLVAVLAILGLLEPAIFQWRNHPNQAAYIQPLAGGPRAVFAQYDLDYWGNCLLQGLTFVNEHVAGERCLCERLAPDRAAGRPVAVSTADPDRADGLESDHVHHARARDARRSPGARPRPRPRGPHRDRRWGALVRGLGYARQIVSTDFPTVKPHNGSASRDSGIIALSQNAI